MSKSAPADVSMWRLALPMTLSNLTVPLVGMVDTAVVGRIGVADIGAVALGSSVFAFLCWVFVFIRMGTTGLAAQARGAGDVRELSNWAVRALVVAAVLGVTLVVFSGPLRWLALLATDPAAGVGRRPTGTSGSACGRPPRCSSTLPPWASCSDGNGRIWSWFTS